MSYREVKYVFKETSPATKKLKEEVPKQACHVITTLVQPPLAEDQAAAGPSTQ